MKSSSKQNESIVNEKYKEELYFAKVVFKSLQN